MTELTEIYEYYNRIMQKIYGDTAQLVSTDDKLRQEVYKKFTDINNHLSGLTLSYLTYLLLDYKYLDISTAIFHIYDNNPILNDEYGGSSTNYEKVLYFLNEKYPSLNFIYNKSINGGNINYDLQLLYDINNLNEFFINKDKTFFFLNFGTRRHFTMICLIKISDTLIKLVYINTGEGTDTSVHKKDDFYDLYKTIYFNIGLKDTFIHFIKIFLFFRNYNRENLEEKHIISYIYLTYNTILKDEDLRIFTGQSISYREWCIEMIEFLLDKDNNYDFINNLFNYENFKARLEYTFFEYSRMELRIIEQDKSIYAERYKKLSERWDIDSAYIIEKHKDNISIKAFLEKSYENIKSIYDNKLLLFKWQKAGSCTYKPIVLSIFYYLLSNDKFDHIKNFYYMLSLENYTKLIDYYEKEYKVLDDTAFAIEITDSLIRDKILQPIYDHTNILNNNMERLILDKKQINFMPIQIDTTYTVHKSNLFSFNFENLNEILKDMRNRQDCKGKIISLYQEYNKAKPYKNTVIAYIELLFICILYEFYFNYDTWKEGIFKLKHSVDNDISNLNNYTKLLLLKSESIYILLFIIMMNGFKYKNMLKENFQNTLLLKVVIDPDIKKIELIFGNKILHRLVNTINVFDYFAILFNKEYTQENLHENKGKILIDYYTHIFMQIIYNMKDVNFIVNIDNYEKVFSFLQKHYMYFNRKEIFNLIKKAYTLYAKTKEFLLTHNIKTLDDFYTHTISSSNSPFKKECGFIRVMMIGFSRYYINFLNLILDKIYFTINIQNDSIDSMLSAFRSSIDEYIFLFDTSNINDKSIIYIRHGLDFYIYLLNNIANAFKDDNIEINDDYIIQLMDNYVFKIDNPYFKYKNGIFSYQREDGIYITDNFDSIKLNKQFQLSSLICHSDDYCFISKDKLFIINNYKNDQLVFQFNIIRSEHNKSFILLDDNIYINLNKVFLSNNISLYPFIAHAPRLTLNFVTIDRLNNIGIYSLVNYKPGSYPIRDEYNTMRSLYNITKAPQIKEYIYIPIKDNYLTPVLNNNKFIDKLSNFYKNYKTLLLYIEQNSIENISPNINNNININKITLPSIEGILTITRDHIDNILSQVAQTQISQDNLHLVDWLNKDIDKPIITLDKYGENATYICNTKCDNIQPHFHDIQILINKLHLLLRHLTSKLNHRFNHINEYKSYLEFLNGDNNSTVCSYIMRTNIYIKNLIRLNDIITNCKTEPLSCHEIMEINSLFNRHDINISLLASNVEIIFGNIIRKEQWEKIFEIYENFISQYNEQKQKFKIHQFMMGKGKSSIITPMLVVLLTFAKILLKIYFNTIYIIVPSHLISQTEDTFIEYKRFFNLDYIIISDNDIKLKFLKGKLDDNDIYIIDEFDYMYNPLQSNFNIVEKETIINPRLVDKIIKSVVDRIINKSLVKYTKYSLEEAVDDTITDYNNEKFIKNVSFGMSHKLNYQSNRNEDLQLKQRLCIPYIRKDSPIEDSKFSSNVITFVLTMLYFYNKEHNCFILELNDIKIIKKYNKTLFIKICSVLYPMIDSDILLKNNMIDNYYNNTMIEDKMKIQLEDIITYFELLFNSFKESTSIINCSFIDIINKSSKWQVGYSGTVNIDIEPFRENNKYDNIIPDLDEEINVRNAIEEKEYAVNIIPDNVELLIKELKSTSIELIKNDLLNELVKYSVIIDCCALFKDIDNTMIALLLNAKTKKHVIFLLSDNTKKICKGGIIFNYEYYPYKYDEIIYYYSQKHIVGIDFKQPSVLNGLLILNSSTKYTEVAQAIYRMRKLNKGHKCKIGIVTNKRDIIITTEKIYEIIKSNDEKFNANNTPLLHFQYLKCYYRQKSTNYTETDIQSYYMEKIKDDVDMRKLIERKFNNNIGPLAYNILIREAYTKILSQDLSILMQIMFSKNSIDTQVNVQAEAEEEAEAEAEAEAEVDVQKQIIIKRKAPFDITMFFRYNLLKPIDEFIKEYVYIEYDYIKNNTLIKLLFSYNLMMSLIGISPFNFIIIELKQNVFLLEIFTLIEYYIPIAPIYNDRGIIMNDSVFTTSVKKLDLNMFNIAFESDEFNYLFRSNLDERELIINIGTILFNKPIEEQEKIKISSEKLISLIYLIYYSSLDVFNISTKEIIPIIQFYKSIGFNKMFIDERIRIATACNKLTKYNTYISDYIELRPLNVNLMFNAKHETDMVLELNTVPKLSVLYPQNV